MRSRMLAPLATRDFALFWAGQSISLAGDGLFTVALAWQALLVSDRPGALAAVLLARSIPQVILLVFGGVLTDRMPRRGLLVLSDAVRGAAVLAVAALVASGAIELWHLVTLGALFGTANALFFPAFTAIVPDLLPSALLPSANALNATSRLIAMHLAGPALGGTLIATAGTEWAFAIDGLTYCVAVATALAIRTRPSPPPPTGRMRAAVAEGYRYTRSQPWLWVTLVAAAFGNFAFSSFSALFPVLIKTELHAGARGLGFASAAFGIGGGLAALVTGRAGLPKRRILSMYASWTVAGAGLLAIGFSPAIGVAAGLMLFLGATMEYGNLVWTTLMQDLVPAGVLGRVSSLDWMLSLGLTPLAFALAGPLAEATGVVPVLAGAGALSLTANLIGATRRGVFDPDRVHTVTT